MQLRHLKTFLSVASTLNVTRASEQLHLSQSSVTEQVQALEADLGAKLFDRSLRKLSLTPAGQRLLDRAGDILQLVDETRAAVGDTTEKLSGRLVIGGLETLCATMLPALLSEFHRLYPDVELAMKTADSGQLLGGLKSGNIDVGFIFGEPVLKSGIRAEQVAQDQLVVIAPPNHQLASLVSALPGDVLDQSFLVTEHGCIYRRMFDDVFAASLPLRPKLAGEFASIAAIRRLVEAGVGCALVPQIALSGESSAVVTVPLAKGDYPVPVSMLWRQRRVQPTIVKTFLSVARKSFDGFIPAVDHRPHGRSIRS